MEVTPEEFYRVRHAARESGMVVRILRRRGLALFLWRYRRRYGMLVGIILFLLIQFALSGNVWQIDLLSESKVYTREQILTALTEEGVFVGAKRDSIDADRTENAVLAVLPELKRMAISVRHGRVTVELVDREKRPNGSEEEEPTIPSDVVASCDGFIVSVSPYAGEAIVKPGDTVRAGQILISGVYDGNLDRTYLTAAKGEVIAQTTKETAFVLPRTREEFTPTGREKKTVGLFFFGIKINFSPSGRNPYEKCDIINETYNLTVFGKTLPVRLDTQTQREQSSTARELSREELEREGEKIIRAYEAESLTDCTILQRKVRVSAQEETVTLHVTYVCEENIGVTVERTP